MHKVIIIGGGISGLASAWFLREKGWQPLILEAGDPAGGSICSRREAGFLLDTGANSMMLKGEIVPAWFRRIGMDGEMIEANPLAKRRYVLKDGVPIALPNGPLAFLRSPILSLSAKARLLGEPFRPRSTDPDESIAAFVRRRLGPEVLDWMVDPFVSGVFAGDPERLSLRATLPRLAALEDAGGSLLRGAWRARRAKRPRRVAPRLVSFRNGLQMLPLKVADLLGDALHSGCIVERIHREGDLWVAEAAGQSWRASRLVLAVPAYVAAQLLTPLHAELAAELDAIPYPSVMTMALGFAQAQVAHALDGFGMLIPRKLGLETLGVLFSSTIFPGRAPAGQVLLTAFIGGAQNDIGARPDAALLSTVVQEISPALGISGTPHFVHARRWQRAIPQYERGHLDRIRRIDAALATLPGLAFRANWRDGVALGDCIENAAALSEGEGWRDPVG